MTLSPAEEQLEKQYQDYKAGFEQWKERNKESFGTDPYIKYVQQFEEWEKDVEKRRITLRQKAEAERLAAERKAEELARQEQEEQALRARQISEQQEALLARERERQEMERFKAVKYESTIKSETRKIKTAHEQSEMGSQPEKDIDNSMVTVMQQMLSFVTEKSSTSEIGGAAATVNPMVPQQIAPPQDSTTPQLWGNEGSTYLMTDAMFKRWNVRAAPPNFRVPYQPPPLNAMTTPCWLMLKKMQEKNLGLFTPTQQLNLPTSSLSVPPGPPPNAPPPNMNLPPTIFNKIL